MGIIMKTKNCFVPWATSRNFPSLHVVAGNNTYLAAVKLISCVEIAALRSSAIYRSCRKWPVSDGDRVGKDRRSWATSPCVSAIQLP